MTSNEDQTSVHTTTETVETPGDETATAQAEIHKQEGKTLVTIKFRCAGKQYDFDTAEFNLSLGDEVVVETNKGKALGTVARSPRFVEKAHLPADLKPIIRLASEADINMARISSAKEHEAHEYCLLRIRQRKMDMKLVKAEYLFDGSKIIFYFTADGRVDFRELVKDLAQYFHTRIEMRQIGVRDEAKLLGGIGICGRELCCGTFLTDFNPVSVRMAKQQGLALNPTKISGQCGRLLCCLSYEYDTYCKMAKQLPKQGSKLTLDGKTAEVLSSQTLAQTVTVRCEGTVVSNIPLAQLKAGRLQAVNPDDGSNKNVADPMEESKETAAATNQKVSRRTNQPTAPKGRKNEPRNQRPKRTMPSAGTSTELAPQEQINVSKQVSTANPAPSNQPSAKPVVRDDISADGAKNRNKNSRRPQRNKKPPSNKQDVNEAGVQKQQNSSDQEGIKHQKTVKNPVKARSNNQQQTKQNPVTSKNEDNKPNVTQQEPTTDSGSTSTTSKRRNRNRRRPVRKP